jgi:AmmeMemoRadiSam system protein B
MKPKLREVHAMPIRHEGQDLVLLRDPLQLSETQIAIPRPLALLLGLMDGTRDAKELEAALQVRAGVRLAPGLLDKLVDDLDSACLLEGERFAEARTRALEAYREAPFRPMTLDSADFPHQPDAAAAQLQGYVDALPPLEGVDGVQEPPGTIRGLVSPHIDYQRGGPVYAQVWRAVAEAARDAEMVLILGTDHQGGSGMLTLTLQSYATPWGALPTDREVVGRLADALGQDVAFAEELHHRGEHSIELAAVWLHFARGGEAVPMVPVLCGHFGDFVQGEAEPGQHEPFSALVEVLRPLMASRRTLVVAAADLAHVGPAFGDPRGVDMIGKAQLQRADERLLKTVYAGDAEGFFQELRAEGDRRNVCGLPPIYLTIRLLGESTGEPAGYAVCPADPQGTSFVTIAGVILR